MFRKRIRRAVAWLAMLALAAPLAAGNGLSGPRPSSIKLEPVELEGYEGKAFHGWHEVYENRAAMTGRKIKLYVVIVPATGENPEPDPLFLFAGGPGDSAAGGAGFMAAEVGEILEKRDLVLLDQRGTGKSHPLNCDVLGPKDKMASYMGDMFPLDYVRACREKLEKIADLTQYVTDIAMDDADEVRAALGYDKINLMGFSYGSRAVMAFMRRHPESVRAAVLGGMAPVFMAMPSTFAQDAQRALDRLFADCVADPECHAAYPNLREDFRRIATELKRAPVKATVENPKTEEKETVSMDYGGFTTILRGMLYSSEQAKDIPLMIAQAAAGDWVPFAQAKAQYSFMLQGLISDGMYLSVTCAEDIPRFDAATAAHAARGTFLGDYRVSQQVNACKLWPRAVVPESYFEPVKTDLPALLISGEVDPVTPPYWGWATAEHFSNGRHLVVPYAAHSMGRAFVCMLPLAIQFLEEGTAANLDASCLREQKRPPFTLPGDAEKKEKAEKESE